MSKTRLETKVGLFVLLGFILLGILVLQFSKGTALFRPTYDILLNTSNVGGLKKRAGVLMSGVQIGSVAEMNLARDGRTVTITLRIYAKYQIHKDAIFTMEQSGFLGDQYISVQPTTNALPVYKDQETATAVEAFNLQETARKVTGFIGRLDVTAQKLDEAIVDIRQHLVNENTMTNLAATVANLRVASGEATLAVSNINVFVASNSVALSRSGSNLVVFSEQLNGLAEKLSGVIETNSPDIRQAVRNVESATESLNTLVTEVKQGKGLAGKLLVDEQLAQDVGELGRNLSITSSNLNRLGLWGILWSKRPPKTNDPAMKPLVSPRDPFQN